MKIDREKIMNLCKDIIPSVNWGIKLPDMNVDSDDETIQERINQLNKIEHEMLSYILQDQLNILNIWMKQGSR